ncbi:MAG: IS200/IS605 family transposase [Terriglobales bacterium]
MAHTYVSGFVHYVFSTKDRQKCIGDEMQPKLWAYIGGIARQNGMKALAVGGMQDHAHALLSLTGTIAIAKAAQLVKGGSSKWVNEHPGPESHWQDGYGAFTVSVSQVDATIEYILNQAEHHQKRSFEEEFIALLKKHHVDYDPRYVWG